jgi:hypothetical protein
MPCDDGLLPGGIHFTVGEALADIHVGAARFKILAFDLRRRGGKSAQAQQCYESSQEGNLSHVKTPSYLF